MESIERHPKILAPAGDIESFLAAVAAGADAVYCGLKLFSARMEASNFSMDDLSRLTTLATRGGVDVYVAINTLVKENELAKLGRTLAKLTRYVKPQAIIAQDLAVASMARSEGFAGELHLSTLANNSFARGLEAVRQAGFSRVVMPRELTVDEMKAMAAACPDGLDLEAFIHGALCYGVSGRCYWSSWFGGRSGLRGRCVQPCRRLYTQGGQQQRFFSCMDLSVDVLAKVLKEIPKVTTWKIEGRKKSPHYVFYTVSGYRMLRDEGHDPQKKKTALAFLEYALGRPSTHYRFLSQRIQNPVSTDTETGSGLFVGRVGAGRPPALSPREALLKGDLLRVGYEDAPGHAVIRVTRPVPKKGRLVLSSKKGVFFRKGDPVFIVDRRETAVTDLIGKLSEELASIPSPGVMPAGSRSEKTLPKGRKPLSRRRTPGPRDLVLRRRPGRFPKNSLRGLWLLPQALNRTSAASIRSTWWWLPPVIWPDDEAAWHETVEMALKKGAVAFVLNAPWQRTLFPKALKNLSLWAGPFCNITNSEACRNLMNLGFGGVVVSPELSAVDHADLVQNSPIPLGVVIAGNWPLAISRTIADAVALDQPFKSPMNEAAWASITDGNYWIFPGWRLDLEPKRRELEKAGYQLFITMEEDIPKGMELKQRPGLWNWDLKLL